MAVNPNSGCSALADLDYLKRSYNGIIDYVNDGVFSDMDNLAVWLMKFIEDKKKINEEMSLLRSENADLRESNRKLQSRIHEFTQKEFDTKNQKKKMEKDFATYVKRVRIALGIIDQDRMSGLPIREQECIRELSNVTNNYNSAVSIRRVSTNLPELEESQEASWLFNEGDRDASRDFIIETSVANGSRTRSGRTYSRCPTDFQQHPIVFPVEEAPVQRPPKSLKRRSRSIENKLAEVQQKQPITNLASRRSRSETRVLEPLASLTRSPSSSLARPHVFVQDTVVKSHTCAVCQKKSRFGQVMMRCTDCGQVVHPECRNNAPIPCWGKRWNSPATTGTPRVRWATPGHVQLEKTLASYVNELPPFVPAIIIQCVQEIEARGLTESGLYRLSGSVAEIRDLKKQLYQSKIPPNLSQVRDINVIAGVLKDFLLNLPDPVVPFAVRHDFLNALDLDYEQQVARLKDLVKNLTDAHHDTLVYLLLHLQRVASHPATNMPIKNLARVLAPTIFGSCAANHTSVAMTRDTELTTSALEALLNVPSEYWLKQLRLDSKSLYPKTPSSATLKPSANVEPEIVSISGDDTARNTVNSTSSAVGHTVRSFFSRTETNQQARMFTATNPSKKSRRRKDNR